MQRLGSKARVTRYEVRRARAANPLNALDLSNLPLGHTRPRLAEAVVDGWSAWQPAFRAGGVARVAKPAVSVEALRLLVEPE
ncbi:MAG TPA: hypothetical protein VLT15_07710 [Acidimicrobiia bacterium]|nr:hypothetical protein [Acidimicrobiia bacterium]